MLHRGAWNEFYTRRDVERITQEFSIMYYGKKVFLIMIFVINLLLSGSK